MRLKPLEPFRYARFALRRSVADARLLAGVAVAALVATTVVGGAPTYLDSLDRVAVRTTLADATLSGRNIVVVNEADIPVRIPVLDEYDAGVTTAVAERFGDLAEPTRQVVLPPHHFRVILDPDRPPLTLQDFTAMRFHYVEGIADHVTYVDGRAPAGLAAPGPDGQVLEVGMYAGHQLVRTNRVALNEIVTARTLGGRGDLLRFQITGFFEVHDPDEDFWMGRARSMLEPEPLQGFFGPVAGFFVTRAGLERIAEAGPSGRFAASWVVPLRQDALGDLEVEEIRDRVSALDGRLQSLAPGSTAVTGLGISFDALARRIAFSRIPMALIATLLLAFVAYYLYMAASVLAERRAAELGILRSRGAGLGQVVRLHGVEALAVTGIPALLGPFLAWALVAGAGLLPIYDAITGGDALPASIGLLNFALAGAAGAVAFAVLLAPSILFRREGVVAGGRRVARPEEQPFFHRYYLDVALLVVAGYLVWELNLRGGVPVTVSSAGEVETDTAILFTPALLLVAVSLVFLRLFPLAMKGLAHVTVPLLPVWGAIALWRLSRAPYSYAAIVLFLMLASGVVAVAATLSSTLRQSNDDRAEYAVGADVRVVQANFLGAGPFASSDFVDGVRAVPGVVGVSAAMRTDGEVNRERGGADFGVLGVQPREFGRVAAYRDDFSDHRLPDLMRDIEVADRAPPLLAPEDAEELGVWSRTSDDIPNLFLWLRLRTADGISFVRSLGPVEPGPWRFQSTSLEGLSAPVEVLAVELFQEAGEGNATPGVILLDDITAVSLANGSSGDGRTLTVLDGFDERDVWESFPTSGGFDSDVSLFRGAERGVVARFEFGRGANGGVRGIYRPDTAGPTPAVVSRSFVEATGIDTGEQFIASIAGSRLAIEVAGVVELFPTLDPGTRAGFIVIDGDAFVRYADIVGGTSAAAITEMFIGVDEEVYDAAVAGVTEAFPGLSVVEDRRTEQQKSLVDPLAVAGWRGVGLLSGITTLVVVVAGYLTYVSAYSGRMRFQEALMRSMGVSTGDYVRIVVVEHVLTAVAGVTLGTLAGLTMSRIAVSASVRTGDGSAPLPPFNVLTEWAPVLAFFAVLSVAAVAALSALVVAFRRGRLYETTRVAD